MPALHTRGPLGNTRKSSPRHLFWLLMEISPEASQQPCRVATKSSLIDEKSEAQGVGEEEKEGKGETEKPEEPTEGMLAYRRGQQAYGLHAPGCLSLSSTELRSQQSSLLHGPVPQGLHGHLPQLPLSCLVQQTETPVPHCQPSCNSRLLFSKCTLLHTRRERNVECTVGSVPGGPCLKMGFGQS